MGELLGLGEIFRARDFATLAIRLAINLAFASIVIRLVYYRLYRNREYVFTYFLFNIITFSLSYLMRRVPIELGFALGLFAIFGILRYRTEPIRIRDLTYLFIVIGLGILNAVSNHAVSVAELLFVNLAIVALAAFLELLPSNRSQRSQPIFYDNLGLLRPENRDELIADLSERTGLNVVRVSVQKIDMLRDAADIIIYYVDPRA
ncbi:MAG: DUF4956 domain-containing protein [Deltaproteobacteria bacterium]|nr:DUF4956 domain-containing protein [Deltaproteobacteria bacterium]